MQPPKTIAHAAVAVLCLACFGLLAAGSPLAADERLTLRVNDTDARPGDLAAVVVRTYASRPVDQGQVCFRSFGLSADSGLAGAGSEPILTLEDVEVFAAAGDVTLSWVEDTSVSPPNILLSFASPSSTINSEDGPLAVLFFRVSASAPIDARISIDIDLEETALIDPQGLPIDIRPRPGDVRIREPLSRVSLEAEGDHVDAGEPLVIGAETKEWLPLSSGQVTLLLPPQLRDLPRSIDIDPRNGAAVWSVDEPSPGRLVVSFSSPDDSLNRVPGSFLRVSLDTAGATPGSSTVVIDPTATFMLDASGDSRPLDIEAGEVAIYGDGFFAGGFELGDFSEWSATVGPEAP